MNPYADFDPAVETLTYGVGLARFFLRAGSSPIGVIRPFASTDHGPGWTRICECALGSWILPGAGLTQEIRSADRSDLVAILEMPLGGNTQSVEFVGGPRFELRPLGFFRAGRGFFEAAEPDAVMTFTNSLFSRGTLRFGPRPWENRVQLALLALLGVDCVL